MAISATMKIHGLNGGWNGWIERGSEHLPLVEFRIEDLLVTAKNQEESEQPDKRNRDDIEHVLHPSRYRVIEKKYPDVTALLPGIEP